MYLIGPIEAGSCHLVSRIASKLQEIQSLNPERFSFSEKKVFFSLNPSKNTVSAVRVRRKAISSRPRVLYEYNRATTIIVQLLNYPMTSA